MAPTALAVAVVTLAARTGHTIAVAESLTGGALASALVDVPGASAVLRLGVVSYATEMKHRVLGVDAALLRDRGAVDPEVARQMASGVRGLAGIDDSPCSVGVATTGVAGPAPQDGHPVGEVWIGLAVADARGEQVSAHGVQLQGDRDEIRAQSVAQALRILHAALVERAPDSSLT